MPLVGKKGGDADSAFLKAIEKSYNLTRMLEIRDLLTLDKGRNKFVKKIMFTLLLGCVLGLAFYVFDGKTLDANLRLAGTLLEKVTYPEAAGNHPHLRDMVKEEGFNSLSAEEQQELIRLIDKYAYYLEKAEYYDHESPGKSLAFSQDAEVLRKEIETRFGHILKN